MKPTKSILDKSFRYTCAHETDIRKRFRAIKQAQLRETRAETLAAPLPKLRVVKQ